MVVKLAKVDLPKTCTYRGKRYSFNMTFDRKDEAEHVIKQRKKRAPRGTRFFTQIKHYKDANDNPYYAVYWRGTYTKTAVKNSRAYHNRHNK